MMFVSLYSKNIQDIFGLVVLIVGQVEIKNPLDLGYWLLKKCVTLCV